MAESAVEPATDKPSLMRGPLARYEALLEAGQCEADPAQREAVLLLQKLYEKVAKPPPKPGLITSLLTRLLRRNAANPKPVKGIYFWGGVGRGKTFLMDLFYETLPPGTRIRLHFHRFMHEVHQQLKALQGQVNPLVQVAAHFAEQGRVICFDEFFVSDITDAMLLAGLLDEMFKRGAILVATSNAMPDDLYKDGLQRSKFLPAIKLIKTRTRVHKLDGGIDYRLRALEKAETYHYPLDAAAEEGLANAFHSLSPDEGRENKTLMIEGRPIQSRLCGDGVVWFDFLSVCAGPRSQNDYIELARQFNTVLIGKVPQFTPATEDQARRFISLVDEFYDRNVRLILSAQSPPQSLYQSDRLKLEFQRTTSRLQEMQTTNYLSQEHKA